RTDDGWLLKSAFCNAGDSVSIREHMPERQWRRTAWSGRLFPRSWVAQRRFEVTPLDTPVGTLHPCIGVYVIDGRACGAYGRLSRGPVVRYDATDVAVLVEHEPAEGSR